MNTLLRMAPRSDRTADPCRVARDNSLLEISGNRKLVGAHCGRQGGPFRLSARNGSREWARRLESPRNRSAWFEVPKGGASVRDAMARTRACFPVAWIHVMLPAGGILPAGLPPCRCGYSCPRIASAGLTDRLPLTGRDCASPPRPRRRR